MKRLVLASAVLAAIAASASAQNQQVKPPIAVYWVSAETSAGMGVALPPGLGAAMPAGMQGGKRLQLDLGSSQAASGAPRASHAIPTSLSMGQSLPLLTPEAPRAQQTRTDEQPDQPFERPKGRMLIYWGCGESVRAGQPVVIDFAKMGSAEAAKAFRSVNVSRPQGPAPARNRTFGDWPNRENSTPVPQQASLVGDHIITGNYSPEIRFAVGNTHDFMAPVAFDAVRKTQAGAFNVKWQAIPTAIGYFASAMGQGESQNDIVMWSSSDVQVMMGQTLMDYLPPAEVQRLIKERMVMAPPTTECSVPAGIFKSEGSMLQFIAYGDELNVVHPPRPKDPKQVWEQQYAVKLRNKSTGMMMLAEGGFGGSSSGRATRDNASQSEERSIPAQAPRAPNAGDAVNQGIGILRGIFGR